MPGGDEGRHQIDLLALVDNEHIPQQASKVVAVAAVTYQTDHLALYTFAVKLRRLGTSRLVPLGRIDAQVTDLLDMSHNSLTATHVANLDGVAIEDA